jgi:hypothetical protein
VFLVSEHINSISREMYTKFWWENLKERDNSEDLGVYGGDNIRNWNRN